MKYLSWKYENEVPEKGSSQLQTWNPSVPMWNTQTVTYNLIFQYNRTELTYDEYKKHDNALCTLFNYAWSFEEF